MIGGGFALFFLFFAGLWIAAFVFWIYSIVDVARIPDWQFRASGSDKTLWVVIVVLAGIIGALIWRFAKRAEVMAASNRIPSPSPGWYPEPGTGALRWWDGVRWTDTRHFPPPPA